MLWNIELYPYLIDHFRFVLGQSQQSDEFDGILPVIVKVFIFSRNNKREAFMGTLKSNSEI